MSIQHRHQQDWQPPFCPNPNCPFHKLLPTNWPFKKIGFYFRNFPPYRIRRFLCLACRRSFSSQTFSPDYWLKRPDILPKLMTKTCGCMANRQIARDLSVSPSTIDRQLSRLGRHCLLFHSQRLKNLSAPQDITIDGFESFELSQYYPFHHHLAVDNKTGFFLWFTDSPLRRKGRMTLFQKQRRTELERRFGRPDRKAIQKDMRQLLQQVTRQSTQIIIRSDEHRAYPRAIQGLACQIEHQVTHSHERRDKRNRLWEINLLDLLIRHASANHKRETMAWAKRRQGSAERLAVFLVWRNYVNHRWQKRCRGTPAMAAGVCHRVLKVSDVLKERLFPSLVRLKGRWQEYYMRTIKTPALGNNQEHGLRYAV